MLFDMLEVRVMAAPLHTDKLGELITAVGTETNTNALLNEPTHPDE
jgi:hypothetical protein